jgi:hypothetical protein
MKFVGLLLLVVGLAFAWYFLLFFDSSVVVPDTHYMRGSRTSGEWLGAWQRSGLILSLAAAMLGGLALVTANYLPKSFKKPTP